MAAFSSGRSALADKTAEPGQTTIWDQIMRAQSLREMHSGVEHMQDREYDEAARDFAKAVLSRPNDPEPHLMLGAAYYWNGQVESAETEFREALRLDPKSGQAHLLLGIVQAWKGDVSTAYQSFQEADRQMPGRSDVQMNLGSIEQTMGRFPQALEHFRNAVSFDPQNPLYHFQLGMLYVRLGRVQDAEASFRQALRYFPEFEDAALELGAVLERQDKLEDAQDMYHKAVRLKPLDSVARLRWGRVLLSSGRADKARQILQDAFHVTPEDKGGGLALSVSFGGRPPESQAAPADGGRKAPDVQPEPNDPLDVVSRNLQRIPLDQDATLKVQVAFLPRPKLVRAAPQEGPSKLKRALEGAGRAPKPAISGVEREFNIRASDGPQRLEQIEQAIEELRNVMKQSPPDSEVRLGMQLNYASKTAGPARGAPTARAPKVSYQPRQVGNDLGLWVVGTGWMTLVEEVLAEPGEAPAHPEESLWWVVDGLAHAALGNGPSALDAFDRALRLNAKEETALLGRAVAYVEMGREREAIDAYRELLSSYPKNRAAKNGLAWLLREPLGKR